MAKSKARLVTASEKVAGLIDKGFDVDVELKNLTFEDKGIKKMLTDELDEQFKAEDTSIRVEGNKAAATVTQSEKFAINGEAEEVDKVREAAEKGLLGDAVSTEQTLNVPVSDRAKAAAILQAAGINASTSVAIKVDPAEYRILKDSEVESADAAEAKKILEGIVSRSVSYRVKYEKV